MNISQKHLIRVFLTLKKVNITIRFPCSLAFSLKSQKNQIQSPKIYELKNGQSIINETVSIDVEVQYINGKYQQKKLTLNIIMVSTNGKIPAGSVPINPTLNILSESRLSLQKCPDRNACAYVQQRFEILSAEPISLDQKNVELIYSARQAPGKQSGNSSLQKSFANNNLNSSVADILRRSRESRQNSSLSKENAKFKFSQVQMGNRAPVIQSQRRDLSRSKVDRSSVQKDQNRLIYTRQREEAQQRIPVNFDSRGSRVESNYTLSNQMMQSQELGDQHSRILRLEREKSEYIREVARLKTELEQVNEFKVNFLENELERVKTEHDEFSEQVIRLKDLLKDKQRMERDIGGQLKEYRDELQRRTVKLNQIQVQYRKIENEFIRKQKQLAESKQQGKKLKEEVDELKLAVTNQQKKAQLKQNSYKEQIKKLNERYSLAEAEKQKATLELSNLLSQMQNNEKKGQFAIKEKQKAFIEEKGKLTRKVDQLQEVKKKLDEENGVLKQSISELEAMNDQLKKQLNEAAQSGSKISAQNRDLQSKLSIQRKEKEELQKTGNQLQKTLEQERNNFKKKYSELSAQISTTKSQLGKTQASSMMAAQKSQQLQQSLTAKNTEKSSMAVELTSLRKQYEKLKKQDTERQRLAETLSVQNINNEQRINNLTANLQQQRLRFEEMEQEYENQVRSLLQSRAYLEEDLRDFREGLQRQSQKSCILQEQIKKLNEQILELNRQLLQFVQKENTMQTKNKELEFEGKSLKQQLDSLQKKFKQAKTELKSKSQSLYSLQKEKKGYEQEKFMMEQRILQLEKMMKERSSSVKQVMGEKEKKLIEKSDELSQLRRSNEEMRSTVLNLKAQCNQLRNLAKIRTEEKDELQEQKQKLEEQLQTLKQQLQTAGIKIFELTSQCQQMNRQLKDKIIEVQKLMKDFDDFKNGTIEGMRDLFETIYSNTEAQTNNRGVMNSSIELRNQNSRKNVKPSRQINSSTSLGHSGENQNIQNKQRTLVSSIRPFPSTELNELQLQFISRSKEQQAAQLNNIERLQQTIAELQTQTQRLRLQHQEKQQQFEEELFCEKERFNQLIEEKITELNSMNSIKQELQSALEQQERENQILNNEIHAISQSFHQINEQLKTVSQERNLLREQNEIYSQQLHQLKVSQIKLKTNFQDSIKQLTAKYDSSLSSIKTSSKDLQEKYMLMVKVNIQLQQANTAVKSQLQILQKTYSQQQKSTQQQQKVIQSYQLKYQQMQKLLSQKSKQLQQLYHLYQQLNNNHKANSIKLQQLTKHNNSLLQEINQLTIHKEKIAFQLQVKSAELTEVRKQLLAKDKIIKNSSQQILRQNKSLSAQYSEISSQFEIMKFQNERLNVSNVEYEQRIKELTDSLNAKRAEFTALQIKVSDLANDLDFKKGEIEGFQNEIILKEEQLFKLKHQLEQSEEVQHQHIVTLNQLQILQQQLDRQNQEFSQRDEHRDGLISSLQESLVQAKKQLSFRSTKEEEQRKLIRELQSIIEQKEQQIMLSTNRAYSQGEKQKMALLNEITDLQKQLQQKQQEYAFQKQHLQATILQKTQEITQLSSNIAKNEHLLAQMQGQVKFKSLLIAQLETKLEVTLEQWQEQKATYHPTDQKLKAIKSDISRFQVSSKSIEQQSRQLIEIAKRKSVLQMNYCQTNPNDNSGTFSTYSDNKGISDILREVALLSMRTKTKLLSRCHNDKEKQLIIADYRLLQQKLEQAMRSHNVMKPIGFH